MKCHQPQRYMTFSIRTLWHVNLRSLCWQERFERIRWRTRTARAARHAQVLRRFWHTRQGLVWQDALVVAMLGLSLGLSAVQLRPAARTGAGASQDAGQLEPDR